MPTISMNRKFSKADIVTLDWDTIYRLSSGTDSLGEPNTYAAFQRVSLKGAEASVVSTENIDHAVIYLHGNGGCAVIEMKFAAENKESYLKAMDYIQSFMKADLSSEVFELYCIPRSFEEAFNIVYVHLIFANGHRTADGYSIILCFDNNNTVVVPFTDEVGNVANPEDVEAEVSMLILPEAAVDDDTPLYDEIQRLEGELAEARKEYQSFTEGMYEEEHKEDPFDDTDEKNDDDIFDIGDDRQYQSDDKIYK